jgi:hypothetical protein
MLRIILIRVRHELGREELDHLAKRYLLGVEGVEDLEEEGHLLWCKRYVAPDLPIHEESELLFIYDSIIVLIYLAEQTSKRSKVGLMLSQLEVHKGSQKVCKIDLNVCLVIKLVLQLHLLFPCYPS